jgi:transcriptional regulator with XRE-family HTH domain
VLKQAKTARSGVAARLSRLLAFRGLSIRQLSADAGVPYRTLQDYIGGKRKPGADHLVKLAEVGVDIHWLLTGGRPSLPRGLSEGDLAAGLLASDPQLVNDIWAMARASADGYGDRHFSRTQKALSASEGHKAVLYYVGIILQTAAKMVTSIEELRQMGASYAMLLDLIRPHADLDAKLDQLMATDGPQ